MPPLLQQPLTQSRKTNGLFIFTLGKAWIFCPRWEIIVTDASVAEQEELVPELLDKNSERQQSPKNATWEIN